MNRRNFISGLLKCVAVIGIGATAKANPVETYEPKSKYDSIMMTNEQWDEFGNDLFNREPYDPDVNFAHIENPEHKTGLSYDTLNKYVRETRGKEFLKLLGKNHRLKT